MLGNVVELGDFEGKTKISDGVTSVALKNSSLESSKFMKVILNDLNAPPHHHHH